MKKELEQFDHFQNWQPTNTGKFSYNLIHTPKSKYVYLTLSINGNSIEDVKFTKTIQEKFQLKYPALFWDFKAKKYILNLNRYYQNYNNEEVQTLLSNLENEFINYEKNVLPQQQKESEKLLKEDIGYVYYDDLFTVYFNSTLQTFVLGTNGFLHDSFRILISNSNDFIDIKNPKTDSPEKLKQIEDVKLELSTISGNNPKSFFIINPEKWVNIKSMMESRKKHDISIIEEQKQYVEAYENYILKNGNIEITDDNFFSLYIKKIPELNAFSFFIDTASMKQSEYGKPSLTVTDSMENIFFENTTVDLKNLNLPIYNTELKNKKREILVPMEYWKELVTIYNNYQAIINKFGPPVSFKKENIIHNLTEPCIYFFDNKPTLLLSSKITISRSKKQFVPPKTTFHGHYLSKESFEFFFNNPNISELVHQSKHILKVLEENTIPLEQIIDKYYIMDMTNDLPELKKKNKKKL